jgi:hypothetical protein
MLGKEKAPQVLIAAQALIADSPEESKLAVRPCY